jgi:hypothetical protein
VRAGIGAIRSRRVLTLLVLVALLLSAAERRRTTAHEESSLDCGRVEGFGSELARDGK